MSRLEDLLASQSKPSDAFQRALSAASAELATSPRPRPWRTDALRIHALVFGLTAIVAVGGLAVGAFERSQLERHAAPLFAIVVAQALSAWAAIAPRRRPLRAAAIALSAVAFIAAVVDRPSGGSDSSAWLCPVSHVLVDAGPLVAVVLVLRNAARSLTRSLCAGFAVSAIGLALGEVGCARGWQHVLFFHGAAWCTAVLAAVAATRLRPRAFVP